PLSELILKAYHPPATAPRNLFLLSSAKAKLRGVWHSPQCASASAIYAPLFHSGLCAVLGSNRRFSLKNADQKAISQRWLNGKASVFSTGAVCTAGKLNK